ncbi:MAG: 3'-5' exonuclease [Flammeovirgaceae bacterium]|nr:3'-5' exonuclease [Flammeovirgaceae bacterium]
MTFPRSITKEAITQLPIIKFEGQIHLIDNHKEMFQAIKKLRVQEIIGFDTEKKPTFKKGQYHPTALVQLSTAKEVFLFRINKIGLHDDLINLLESDRIAKIGVGMRDDFVELKRIRTFKENNCIDLNNLMPTLGVEKIGVRNLVGILLEKRVSKNQQVSNWENEVLTQGQKDYAATDAWVCYEMYVLLLKKGYI